MNNEYINLSYACMKKLIIFRARNPKAIYILWYACGHQIGRSHEIKVLRVLSECLLLQYSVVYIMITICMSVFLLFFCILGAK